MMTPVQLERATRYVAALIRYGWISLDQPPRSVDFRFMTPKEQMGAMPKRKGWVQAETRQARTGA